MRKKLHRRVTYWLCLGLAIALLIFPAPVNVKSPAISTPAELRGVWLTNVASAVLFVPWGINRAIHQLAELHFNTVYPVVWNRGHTFYPSMVAKRYIGRSQDSMLNLARFGQDVLQEIITQSHREGLRVIPWFEYGLMAPANSELVRRHPNWLSDRYNSNKLIKEKTNEEGIKQVVSRQVWLNPLNPEVQQFIVDLIVEVVTNYDIEGIQLDDHFGMPVEFGYDPISVWLYQQEHQGNSPPEDPYNAEWMRWRANKITAFMQRVYHSIKAVKPNCLVTLSPNPQDFAYKVYLQDWQSWVQLGLVDELILQVYREDLKSFSSELQHPAVEMARKKIPVGVGILSGTLRTPVPIQIIQEQVKIVRDRGFDGMSFFYWETLWTYLAPESPRERRSAFRTIFAPGVQSAQTSTQ